MLQHEYFPMKHNKDTYPTLSISPYLHRLNIPYGFKFQIFQDRIKYATKGYGL